MIVAEMFEPFEERRANNLVQLAPLSFRKGGEFLLKALNTVTPYPVPFACFYKGTRGKDNHK